MFYFIIVFTVKSFGQNLDPYEAEELFNKKYYTAVWEYYKEKLRVDSLNPDLNYKLGMCYLNSRSQKDRAVHYLNRAVLYESNNSIKKAKAYKQLGNAYYITSSFDNAISSYEKYQMISKSSIQSSGLEDINHEIEMCKIAKELQELKELTSKLIKQKNEIKKSFKNISAYERIGYSVSNSSPAFHSNSINFKRGSYDLELFEENKKEQHKNLKSLPKVTDSSKTKMETTVASSVDGQIILIYRDDNGETNLYASELRGNEWMEPEILSKPINNSSWEPDEFLTCDARTLYFASKRSGGYGGKDIYKSEKLPNGEWGKAINMGPSINTIYDEEAPFIFPNEATLYFSSNRNRPRGGFDNFSSSYSDSTGWSVPKNIGYPLHEDGKSNLQETNTLDTNIKRNNYISTFISQKNTPITLVKGIINNVASNQQQPSIEIIISNNQTKQIASIYHPDKHTGKYICMVPEGENINITYEAKGYLFKSENINVPNDKRLFQTQEPIVLSPINEGSKTTLNNIFFENGKSELSSNSEFELERIYNFLKSNPDLSIELSFTADKKTEKEDIKLLESKIQSIVSFLTDKGIEPTKIKSEVYKKSKSKSQHIDSYQNRRLETLELKILASK
ncbi:MAG: hypothetical protein V4565_12965 [Bacteroidota bacterium]